MSNIQSISAPGCLTKNETVTVEGYTIYGSPVIPDLDEWAFYVARGPPMISHWQKIPSNTDVFLTHTPPLGRLDVNPYVDDKSTQDGGHCGELALLEAVHRIKPIIHVFGHIHEGYGVSYDGNTLFINAAIVDEDYRPVNKPIVVDLPRKK